MSRKTTIMKFKGFVDYRGCVEYYDGTYLLDLSLKVNIKNKEELNNFMKKIEDNFQYEECNIEIEKVKDNGDKNK